MASARRDVHIGLFILAFASFFFYFSFSFTQPAYQAEAQHVGPAFMPRILLVLLAILSLVLIFSGIFKAKGMKVETANQPAVAKAFDPRPVIMFVAFAFYTYIATVLGFVSTTLLFLIISFYLLGFKKLWQIFILSPFITAAIYYLFAILLNVWLPAGIWI